MSSEPGWSTRKRPSRTDEVLPLATANDNARANSMAGALRFGRWRELSTAGRRVAYLDHDAGRRWATHWWCRFVSFFVKLLVAHRQAVNSRPVVGGASARSLQAVLGGLEAMRGGPALSADPVKAAASVQW